MYSLNFAKVSGFSFDGKPPNAAVVPPTGVRQGKPSLAPKTELAGSASRVGAAVTRPLPPQNPACATYAQGSSVRKACPLSSPTFGHAERNQPVDQTDWRITLLPGKHSDSVDNSRFGQW